MGVVDTEKVLGAERIDRDSLVLDGMINETFWNRIDPVNDFLMTVPVEGGEPSERTEIRVAYDENNLYLGVILYDSEPSKVKAFQKKRDGDLDTDDKFSWILDTFLDNRNAYMFEINPAGAMVDGLITIGQGIDVNNDWDGIWRVWTSRGDYGWSAEIRIPFRTLNFDPDNTEWGINFRRTIRRKNENLMWSGYRRNQGLLRPQNAGRLTGLKEISQGLGLEVIPYLAVRNKGSRDEDSGQIREKWEQDLGFDVNYSITPGLKASFTYNTDFAEAEVDTRQINLTRFPLVFPERRDFFLEGVSIYSFAPISGQRPYFSRKIGLNQGTPIPIAYGARLLGRVGNFDVALQHVRTKEEGEINAEDFTVARVRKNFLKESRIGVVYTRRSTKDGDLLDIPLQDRHTFGTDLALNTSEFLGDKNLQFEAFLVTHNPSTPIDDSTTFWDRTSRGMRINFPNQPWSGHVSYREFGYAFDPAVGFHPRVNFRRIQPSIGYNPLLEKSDVVRDIEYNIWFEYLVDMDWVKLTQELRPEFQIRFESGERIEISVIQNYERLTNNFDILRDSSIVIPSGQYTVWFSRLEVESAPWRKVKGEVTIEAGEFWTGKRQLVDFILVLRPVPGVNLTSQFIHTNVALEEGDFKTNILRFIGSLEFTPFLSFSTNIQFDNLSDLIGTNNRFRWTLTPGTDLYLVYNHNWLDMDDRWSTTDRTAIMKFVYTHRF